MEFAPHILIEINGTDVTGHFIEADIELGDVSTVGSTEAGQDTTVRTASFSYFSEDLELSYQEPMSHVKVWCGRTVPDAQPPSKSEMTTIFEGYVDENLPDYPQNRLECTDLAKKLQTTFILDATQYPHGEENTVMWQVIQQILDDHAEDSVTLYTKSGTPSDPIVAEDLVLDPEEDDIPVVAWDEEEPFTTEYRTVWDAVQAVAQPVGFYLGYQLHDNTGEFELTLMIPPIDKEPGDEKFDYSWSNVYLHEMDAGDADVRNYVRIIYDIDDDGSFEYVDNSDLSQKYQSIANDSQDSYGTRAMEIEYSTDNTVDRESATQLAKFAINDLAKVVGNARVETPLEPEIRLFDAIAVEDPRVPELEAWSRRFVYDKIFYCVDSIRHHFAFGDTIETKTELICSEIVISGKRRWQELEEREGANRPVDPDDIDSKKPLPPPKDAEIEGIYDGIAIWFKRPRTSRWQGTEVYVDTESDVSPITENLVTTMSSNSAEFHRGFEMGESYYAKLRHVGIGEKSPFVEIGPATPLSSPDEEVPSPVEWNEDEIKWGPDYIKLAWHPHPDPSYDQYEVRKDDNFGAEGEI